jgi:hypothetical protein
MTPTFIILNCIVSLKIGKSIFFSKDERVIPKGFSVQGKLSLCFHVHISLIWAFSDFSSLIWFWRKHLTLQSWTIGKLNESGIQSQKRFVIFQSQFCSEGRGKLIWDVWWFYQTWSMLGNKMAKSNNGPLIVDR